MVPEGAAISLKKGEAGPDGKHEWIGTEYGAPSRFKVPAGKYLAVVEKDYATASQLVEVTPAGVAKVVIDLNAGYLAFTSPSDSTLQIFSSQKDLSGARKLIGTEYYGTLNKTFPVGAYHVVAKSSDGAVIGEKEVEVKPGARTEGSIP